MSQPIWHVTRDGTPARRGDEPFVHASFTPELAETLRLHFADAPTVELLRLDEERLGDRLVVERSRRGLLFPHVYGEIEDDDVVGRVTLRRGPDGNFDLTPVERESGPTPPPGNG